MCILFKRFLCIHFFNFSDVSPPLVFGQDVSLIAAMEKEASSEEAVEAKFENTTPRQVQT